MSTWITYKGKRILYSDYRGMNTEQMIAQLREEANMIMNEPGKVLNLSNFEGTVIAPEFMKVANELGKTTEKKIEKSAVVGVTGVKAVLLNSYNMITGGNIRAFKDEESAKEYLVS